MKLEEIEERLRSILKGVSGDALNYLSDDALEEVHTLLRDVERARLFGQERAA